MSDRPVTVHMQVLDIISRSKDGTTTNTLYDTLRATGYSNKEKLIEIRESLVRAQMVKQEKKGEQKLILTATDFGKSLAEFDHSFDDCYLASEKVSSYHFPRLKSKAQVETFGYVQVIVCNLIDFEMIKVLLAIYYYLIMKYAPNEHAFDILDRFLVSRLTGHLTQKVNRAKTIKERAEDRQESLKKMKSSTDHRFRDHAIYALQFPFSRFSAKLAQESEEQASRTVYPSFLESMMIYDLIRPSIDIISKVKSQKTLLVSDKGIASYYNDVLIPVLEQIEGIVNPLRKAADARDWQREITIPGPDLKNLEAGYKAVSKSIIRSLFYETLKSNQNRKSKSR